MGYESTVTMESKEFPGVRFKIARMSFGRRLELTRRVRELSRRFEFLQAGSDAADRIEAGLISAEVDRLYLLWGLAAVDGMEIDGEPATAERLVETGPELLCQEILTAIKAECGLSEDERKN
jgi:hypothetical protein